jgi:DNA-binding beta-propeller fold protein YncE
MKLFCSVCFFVYVCAATGFAREFVIDVVAGTGAAENNGNAGAALAINIGDPFGVEVGLDGALYITETRNHRVRRLDVDAGELTTVAGTGRRGYSGDGGSATEAQLNEPYEVRFDRQGNTYFVEMQNHVIRRIDHRTKTISTIAGTGERGFSGDGGPATEARFNQPHSIALDRDGAIYVADIGNHRIRRIDPASGIVTSIAGSAERRLPIARQVALGNPILGPRALFVDGHTMWIALREGHSVWRMDLGDGILHHVAGTGKAGYSGDGGPAKDATFNGPKGIAVGPDGNVFVVDTENHAIRLINVQSGNITTIAGARDGARNAIDESERLDRPHGICVSADGTMYVGDTLNHRVVRLR